MRAAGVAIMVLLAFAGWADRASADFTNVETVFAFSANDSAAKSVSVTCPAGKQVIGAGAHAGPGLLPYAEHVIVDAVRPGSLLGSVTARAREDEVGTSAKWLLRVYARCAPPPAGLQRIAATSASSSAAKSAVAACPAGKRLLGTGAETTGAAGQVLLDGLLPDAGLTRTTANAVEDPSGTTGSWTVTAYAICANPVRGLERIRATVPPDSDESKTVSASCTTGKTLVGTGGTIERAIGPASLYLLEPGEQGVSMGAFVTSTQTTTNWAVSAYAICAAGARLVSTTSRDVTGGMWTREAPCPAGTESTGLGGEVALGFPAIWLRHVRTTDDIDRTQVLAGGQGNGPWELTAHAICRTETAGTTIASVAGPSDPAVSQSVTAACPGGTRVVGAGGDAAGGTEEEPFDVSDYVHVTAVRPDAALRAVTVTAEWYHPMGVTGPWRPQAWAICAPAPPGLERLSASSPVTTDVHAYAVAGCPAGKHLIGIGGEIAGGGRYKGFDDLAPDPGLTRVSVLASGYDSAGTSPWSVTAYGICVNR